MLTYARWKYVLILIVLVWSTLYALPNVFPQDPSVQITPARAAPVDAALQARVSDALRRAGVGFKSVSDEGDDMLVRLANPDAQVKAADALRPALGSDYVVALNLASTVPAWLESLKAKPMLLGLDLQGGVRFLMQVDQQAALDKRMESIAEDVRSVLRDKSIPYVSVERRGADTIIATLAPTANAVAARQAVTTSQPTLTVIEGRGLLTVQVPQAELNRAALEAIDQNVTTLRNRVNALGVAEPVVQRQGADRVVIELPGVQDTAAAKRMIGATATLEYRAVVEGDAQDAATTGILPPQARLYYERGVQGAKGRPVLLNKRLIASGDEVERAQSTTDPQSGTPAVSVTLSAAAGQRMFDFTSNSVGKPMAVVYIERIPELRVVDGKEVQTTRISEEVISVANVNEPFGRQFQTTGLERREAEDLAKLLKSGSLAAPMTFVEERIIGPSLGAENVERGLSAVLFSFLFALVFFLVYYRVFGVITCAALLINLLMLVAVMSIFGATLSLPGLAGIALTVGMSVDANVLINERIREELRAGMPPQTAIATGYEKASGTIADANLTAILAGVALVAFGEGPVKGFAIAMIVGILTSMYTAVSVSRGIATLIYGRRRKLKSVAI